jgi:hypothetical protein
MVDRIEFDFDDFTKTASHLGVVAEQIPFALALAMNRSADVTRGLLITQTWPQHVRARNSSFIAASLTTRESRASKTSLSVEIYDKLDRGNLQLHALGGERSPQGGSALAVPSSQIAKTSHGIPARLRPKNLPSKNTFRVRDAIYQRDSRKRMRLLYVLKAQTRVPKQVPFYEDFGRFMMAEMERTIPQAIERAMATRRG